MSKEQVHSRPEVLSQVEVLGAALADVAVLRERARHNRIAKLGLFLAILCLWMWLRLATGQPVTWGLPTWGVDYGPALLLTVLLLSVLIGPALGAGRSPHVLFRPSELEIDLSDVKGAGLIVDEVVKTLNLFLAFKTFREHMGGNPRRAILFEGPPGTGKTYVAKAMAREAGVPFLFVSASAFQSMYYGQTNRKIRSFFRVLRRLARTEGGAIGFIEEIDAIGAARTGMASGNSREGISGVVNELLIQMQSFEMPSGSQRIGGWLIDQLNRWLPHERQLLKPRPHPANILIIGATNRAADLDPALLRPGRFDRTIHFDLPSRSGRREILDYYLAKKSHHEELDDPVRRDGLAAMTFGYSPVMIEHLLDEALVWALRRGHTQFDWTDIQQAKLTEEVGLKQPVEYTEKERLTVATHEAGHALIAYLVGQDRKLEVLSIIKRRDALGLLAHSDREERFTRSKSEIRALIQISLGGLVAEEVFFGESGTGPAGDLTGATNAAASMVGSLGMAGSLISFDAAHGPMGQSLTSKVLSDQSAREAVERILDECKSEVTTMVLEHKHVIEAIRLALLERDELVGEEITQVIEAGMLEVGARGFEPRTSAV